MFKKTIIASALAMAAFSSQAAVVAVTADVVSQEGAAGQASIAVPSTLITLGAEYAVNDTITITVSGAEFATALSTPSLVYADASGGDASGTVTLGLLNSTATSVTYRITEIDVATGDAITTADTLTFTGMVLTTSTVLDAVGDISLSYSALTNTAQALDGTGTLTDISNTVVAQFSGSTTSVLNGIIDVENDRQQFTAVAPDTATTDTFVVTPVEAAAAVHDAVYDGATYVITGDFSWMETDGDAGIDAAELAAALAVTGAGDDTFASVINAGATAITVTATDAGADAVEATTFTFTNAGVGTGNAVLSVQSFTVDTTLNYTTAAAAAATKMVQTGASAGAWTLNGAQALFNYVAVGYTGLQNSIVISNTGIKDGGVVVEGFDEAGNTYGPMTMADTLTGGTQMTVTGPNIMDLLTVPAGTKLTLTITVNAPDADVDFSGYTQKAGTGRQLMAVKYL
ncbi:hypothetical protein [uncultured Paraglaciecola sp.]|uniref:hypothetical protein n=1 Tax=uncultured Paraglaciecola sp. TaxID=1765024 RepID=UPI0025CEECD9|nr:hypothetical protein [uncultured Paraglaciecola sp.]